LSNAQYNFSFTNGILTITQALLGVVVSNQTRPYGGTNPAFSGLITGIKNGDSITAVYTAAATNSPIGNYPIVPTLSGAMLTNYSAIVSNGTLAVTPVSLTVTADNNSRLYGAPIRYLPALLPAFK